MLIHINDLDSDLITFLDLVTNIFDAAVTYLRDVHEAIGAWKNFYKGSKVDDLFDFAKLDFSDFDFLDQVLHILNGLFGGFLIRGGD